MSAPVPTALTFDDLVRAVDSNGNNQWARRISSQSDGALHVAVMREPFRSHLLEGRKTVESRFSRRRGAPWGRVATGDSLLIKADSGPVVGLALVAAVEYHELDGAVAHQLRARYARQMCATDARFWQERADCRYATLIHVSDVQPVAQFAVAKHDRRAWVTLNPASQGTSR